MKNVPSAFEAAAASCHWSTCASIEFGSSSRGVLERVDLFGVCANDLEGIVAKCLADPYDPQARWFKIKNRDYTQKERAGATCSTGRGNGRRIQQGRAEIRAPRHRRG